MLASKLKLCWHKISTLVQPALPTPPHSDFQTFALFCFLPAIWYSRKLPLILLHHLRMIMCEPVSCLGNFCLHFLCHSCATAVSTWHTLMTAALMHWWTPCSATSVHSRCFYSMSQLSTGQKDSIELWCNYHVDVSDDHQTGVIQKHVSHSESLSLSLFLFLSKRILWPPHRWSVTGHQSVSCLVVRRLL